ncbi:CDP-glycerol--poly(glycerophosphate) glycerophosphotransferase [Providencia alcalifaciens]|uniref:CDP-glycerol--poly(glycerophosphate) glycerophosphotransferase n=1 Tax=Providencia alcalifaciens TaxID=126385 RepID=UPI00029BD83E|nr:CDP-glycerol--poly(glycerophosphate) glycerophosphotransferase [Providencia alcalifaciens]EKT63111.1 CDP-glycerol:poly(glycerophosphate) glycerophosphotransferase [Providencia alcalifaciens Dmel2]
MVKKIRRFIPKFIDNKLVFIKKNVFDSFSNKKLMAEIQQRHKKLELELQKKKSIKVVFLVIHKSVWKVDSIFQIMLKDPLFEPIVMVCPDIVHDEEHMWLEMKATQAYFESKNYPVISAYNQPQKKWVKLNTINPDIVFLTNPHKLTRQEYYEDAYLNYLSCYVPYHHEIVNNSEQFNQRFHIAQWKIYSTNESSMQLYKKYSPRYGNNVILTGYPAMEEFIEKTTSKTYIDVWKTNDNRLRVIWAPHHSIEMNENIPYSNFIQLAETFKDIARDYNDKIIWCFKPHPLLKIKLYEMPDWGKERTDSYYSFWENNEYTQLEQGEYADLFASSDAMIHDSGSFLAEYLYMKKPVLYILSSINSCQYYSEFGLNALKACELAKTKDDIILFLESILKSKKLKDEHLKFLDEKVSPYFSKEKPSEKIIKSLLEFRKK